MEGSEFHVFPVSSLHPVLVDHDDVSPQLLVSSHACPSAAMLPTMMVTDSNPLKL